MPYGTGTFKGTTINVLCWGAEEKSEGTFDRVSSNIGPNTITVWYEIIFPHLNGYNLANMPDIDKIPFDYCLDINS